MKMNLAPILGRFKTNFIALANAGLAFVNSILYIRAFGVSITSDSLYYSSAIIAAFSLLPGFLTEQFLQYFNDYKHRDPDKAGIFLAFNLVIVGAFGLILVGCFRLGLRGLIAFMYPTLGAAYHAKIGAFLGIMEFELFLVGFKGLFQSLLVSYGRIKAFYAGTILNSSLILAGQLLIIAGVFRPESYPRFFIAGSASLALFMAMVNRRILVDAAGKARFIDWNFVKTQGPYFRNSFLMRLGHNLQGFFLPLVTSAFWSHFEGNMATCYNYASKFYAAIQSVIIGPSQLETQYVISNGVSRREYDRIPATIRDYLRTYLPIMLAASLATLAVIAPVIHLINRGIGPANIGTIRVCFLFLSLWLAVQCAEGPFVITIVAKNRGMVFVVANAINISIIAAAVFLFGRFFYSILIANILAQAASMSIYCLRTAEILRTARQSPARPASDRS
jgi:hypothetical protein